MVCYSWYLYSILVGGVNRVKLVKEEGCQREVRYWQVCLSLYKKN